MATSGKNMSLSGAVLLMLLSISFWASGAHALQVENCLSSNHKVHLTVEMNGHIQESDVLPGKIINFIFAGTKDPLSQLAIVLETEPYKVYSAARVDLKGLSLSAKIKIGSKTCGYKNKGLAAEVYTNFLGFFSFKLSICLTPKIVKH